MKNPILIILKNEIDQLSVCEIVQQQGGCIRKTGNQIGYVHANDGTVWIFFDESEADRAVTMELVGDEILGRFGGPYGSSVTLEGGSNTASAPLVRDLAIAFCEFSAPAFVYDYMGTLFSLDDMILMRSEGRSFLDISNEKLNDMDIDGML